jgi:hypothetical protein
MREADIQMAGYAVALRAPTRYAVIESKEPAVGLMVRAYYGDHYLLMYLQGDK